MPSFKPVVGFIQEKYCSEACYSEAGRSLFVWHDAKPKLDGECIICKTKVIQSRAPRSEESEGMLFQWLRRPAFCCNTCVQANRLKDFLASATACCVCGRSWASMESIQGIAATATHGAAPPTTPAGRASTSRTARWWQFWMRSSQTPTKPKPVTVSASGTASERVGIAMKAWYRERAKQWWRGSPKQSGICDICNADLSRGEGYLRPGDYLCCERCTNNALTMTDAEWEKALRDIQGYFGPGIPLDIVRLARSS